MSEPEEALNKALACERHAQNAPNDLLRAKFRRLRDSWIRIANASALQAAHSVRNKGQGIEARGTVVPLRSRGSRKVHQHARWSASIRGH
jgi:hypothetical protein